MTASLPLFDVAPLDAVTALEAERETLKRRIADLPPYSHRSLRLQIRLLDLTNSIMAIKTGKDAS